MVAPMTIPLPRHPSSRPFLRRGVSSVQVGTDPERAVVLDGLDADVVSVLVRLDGRTARPDLPDPGGALPAVLDALETQGLLEGTAEGAGTPARLARLGLDLAALAVRTGSHDGARRVLARRGRRGVVVRGADRTAALVAVGLAAAGVGTVALEAADRLADPVDLTPAGPEEAGRSWHEQVSDAVRRHGASPLRTTIRARRPDLVVVTGAADTDEPWTDPARTDDLLADGVVHLPVAVSGDAAVVGPLVVPGRTACLWCAERRRADLDRAWPALADQLRARHAVARSGDGPLTALAAGFAVTQALRVVDGLDPAAPPACLGARLVLRGPDGVPEREPVAPHPVCGCGWAGMGDTMAG
jgi:bacteriocin biosynthesis cyclodehydratase domain-containing protein